MTKMNAGKDTRQRNKEKRNAQSDGSDGAESALAKTPARPSLGDSKPQPKLFLSIQASQPQASLPYLRISEDAAHRRGAEGQAEHPVKLMELGGDVHEARV